jgi:hypothetical protein
VERAAVTRNPAALSIPCGCGWPATTSPPAEIRAAGRQRLVDHLQAAGGLSARQIQTLADRALAAAVAQQLAVPGERLAARLIRELAAEALACRQRVLKFDRDLAKLLERHPDAALIRSLPGMGAVLTAELIAEAGTLARFRSADAPAAGLAPVLRQSGKVRFQRRPSGGNKGLKRVFYQSAFCSLSSPDSRAFYARKRREGKANATTRSSSPSPAGASTCCGPSCTPASHSNPITRRRLDERIRLHHPAWQPGQAEVAAGGGADRRPAQGAAAPISQSREGRITRRGRTTPPVAHRTKTPGSSAMRGGAGQMSSRGRFRPRRR